MAVVKKTNKIRENATKADIARAMDELAILVNRGFNKLEESLGNFRTEVGEEFKRTHKQLENLQYEFMRLETYVLKDLARRVEALEDSRKQR